MKKQKQFHKVEVVVSIPRAGEFIAKVDIDLWGLVQGSASSLEEAAKHELVNQVLQKLKVTPTKGELKKLLANHRVFHSQE
jgi:iron-sulfur cluster repair protein YtfE (RIC family)